MRNSAERAAAIPSDQDRKTQLSRSWEANAAAWANAVRDGAIASRGIGTDAAILRAILERAPRRVLDVGCGEGWLARTLATHDVDVTGIDASNALVERARAAGGGTFHVCSYADLPEAGERLGTGYDVAVCNFALLEEDVATILRALRSLLAPRGVLLIQTVHPWTARGDEPYRDGWRTETFASFGGEFREPMPWYYRTLESWLAVVRAAGYGVASVREPVHPETGEPLSLLIAAEAARI